MQIKLWYLNYRTLDLDLTAASSLKHQIHTHLPSYLKDIYLKTNSQIHNGVLTFYEVVEFVVKIRTNTHVCIHSMELASEFITTGLLEKKQIRN